MPPRPLLSSIIPLSAPELRALEWSSYGLTHKMAAEMMFASPDAVKTHLEAARLKLCAKNTSQAVANAIRWGLIR